MVVCSVPSARFHSRMSPSSSPVAISQPSGEAAILRTQVRWPTRRACSESVAMFHSTTARPLLAAKNPCSTRRMRRRSAWPSGIVPGHGPGSDRPDSDFRASNQNQPVRMLVHMVHRNPCGTGGSGDSCDHFLAEPHALGSDRRSSGTVASWRMQQCRRERSAAGWSGRGGARSRQRWGRRPL